MNQQRRKWVLGTVSILLCVIVIGIILLVTNKAEDNIVKEEKKAEKVVETKETDKNEGRKIDFLDLQATNADTYAWIHIPETGIDYPILQSVDDQAYYLNHTFEKQEELRGAIYTENLNLTDFTDPNTVLYGHNMADRSMFTDLHKYEDATFLTTSPYVYIYTPTTERKYQIFATVNYDDRHLLRSINFQDFVSYEEFLNDIRNPRDMVSHVNEDVAVSATDRIITLSTCHDTDSATRWLVVAVLVEEHEATHD